MTITIQAIENEYILTFVVRRKADVTQSDN